MGNGISENRKQRGGCGCFSQGYGSLCHFHYTGTFGHGHCQRKEPELTCPKCKNHRLLVWNKVVKCPDKACGWLQFRIVCGVPLSLVDIERSEEHTSELQSRENLVCRLLLEKKKKQYIIH